MNPISSRQARVIGRIEEQMTQRRVIVVGGGAAGLMAAGQAAEVGAETLLLEKMKRPGRKLRIAGKVVGLVRRL